MKSCLANDGIIVVVCYYYIIPFTTGLIYPSSLPVIPYVRIGVKGARFIFPNTQALGQLSNEKYPGCLGYMGDYTTQLYGDYNKPL